MISVSEEYEGALIQANHYYGIGRYAEAREGFLTLMEAAPESGELLYKIAYCEYQLGLKDESVEHCRQGMQLGYRPAHMYALLGLMLRVKGAPNLAEQVFKEGISEFPDNAELRAQYAYLLWLQKHRRKARALLAEALAIDPTHKIALYYQFHMEHGIRSRKRRVEIVRQYMDLDVSEIERLQMITSHLIKNNKFHEAREACRQAFILDPTDVGIRLQLENLEMVCHPVFFFNRMVSRIGKRTYVYGAIGLMVLLMILQAEALRGLLVAVFFLIGIWTRLAKYVYQLIQSARRKWA